MCFVSFFGKLKYKLREEREGKGLTTTVQKEHFMNSEKTTRQTKDNLCIIN